MQDFSQLYESYRNAVVLVFNDKTGLYGTGFITKYNDRYFLISAYHVIEKNNFVVKCIVENVNNTGMTRVVLFQLIGYDQIGDIAISVFSNLLNNTSNDTSNDTSNNPFSFNSKQQILQIDPDSRSVRIGTQVIIIATMADIDSKSFNVAYVGNNMYGGYNDGSPIPESLFLEGFVFEGNSGGPVITTNGSVIGMISGKIDQNDYAPNIAISSNIMSKVITYFLDVFNSFSGTYQQYIYYNLQHGYEIGYFGVNIRYMGVDLFKQFPNLETLMSTLAPPEYSQFNNIGGMVIDNFIQAVDTVNSTFVYNPTQYIDGLQIVKLFNPLATLNLYSNFYVANQKYPVILMGITYLDYFESISVQQNIYKTIALGKFVNQVPYSQFKYESYYLEDPWDPNSTTPAKFTLYYIYNYNNNWVFNVEDVYASQINPADASQITYFNAYTDTYDVSWNMAMPLPIWNYISSLSLMELARSVSIQKTAQNVQTTIQKTAQHMNPTIQKTAQSMIGTTIKGTKYVSPTSNQINSTKKNPTMP